MFQAACNQQLMRIKRYCAIAVLISFGLTSVMPVSPTYAQTEPSARLALPEPGTLVQSSQSYTPVIVNGIKINPDNPFEFDFVIDTGDDRLAGDDLERESKKLINYFLAALTVPEDQLWVNLSPYEDQRIIADGLVRTEMGRDMLAQDYLLKQLMASLMYPERELGRAFWERVHQKAYAEFGTTDIPTNTFNKIWIVPERASVHIHENTVFVVDAHLKVMLEEDYLSLAAHPGESMNNEDPWNETTKEIIRTILIPEIEREINSGRNFANLRQIYHSMLLATWYKRNLREGVLGEIYLDQNLVGGIDHVDPKIKQDIYQQYVEAFEKGVFNYIREDLDPESNMPIPRRYFSGGLESFDQAVIAESNEAMELIRRRSRREHVTETVRLDVIPVDAAMSSDEQRLAGLSRGWGIKRGPLTANEKAFQRQILPQLQLKGLTAAEALALSNALVRARLSTLRYLVDSGYVTVEQLDKVVGLDPSVDVEPLVQRLREDQTRLRQSNTLNEAQKQKASDFLFSKFMVYERYTALNEHFPPVLLLKLIRTNVDPAWWGRVGEPAYSELSPVLGTHSAKRWIADHPDDPVGSFDRVRADYETLRTKIGKNLATQWTLDHKDPLSAFNDLMDGLGAEYSKLQESLGAYLALRWVLTNTKDPLGAFERQQQKLGPNYARLVQALGEYPAKQWIVAHKTDPWGAYNRMQRKLGREGVRYLDSELGSHLAVQWVIHRSNPVDDWMREGPSRVAELVSAGVNEAEAKKALVAFGTDATTTQKWLAALRSLRSIDAQLPVNTVFRKMTRASVSTFATFLKDNYNLSDEQLMFVLRPLGELELDQGDLDETIQTANDSAMLNDVEPQLAMNNPFAAVLRSLWNGPIVSGKQRAEVSFPSYFRRQALQNVAPDLEAFASDLLGVKVDLMIVPLGGTLLAVDIPTSPLSYRIRILTAGEAALPAYLSADHARAIHEKLADLLRLASENTNQDFKLDRQSVESRIWNLSPLASQRTDLDEAYVNDYLEFADVFLPAVYGRTQAIESVRQHMLSAWDSAENTAERWNQIRERLSEMFTPGDRDQLKARPYLQAFIVEEGYSLQPTGIAQFAQQWSERTQWPDFETMQGIYADVRVVDAAMTSGSPHTLDIAAAKLGLSTDTLMFELLMNRVQDEEIIKIIWDVRQAKEDALQGDPNANAFTSFDNLKLSPYEGVQKFAHLIATFPSVFIKFLDERVRHGVEKPVRGVVTLADRQAGEQKVEALKTQLAGADAQTVDRIYRDMAVIRLGFGLKNQIREVLIGQVHLQRIPGIVERILDLRDNQPDALTSYDALVGAVPEFSALLTPELVERINASIVNDFMKDKIGRIENSEMARALQTRVAMIKASQADTSTLLKALEGQLTEDEADALSAEGREFRTFPEGVQRKVLEQSEVLFRLDSLVKAYERSGKRRPRSLEVVRHDKFPTVILPDPDVYTPPSQEERRDAGLPVYRVRNSADVLAHFQQQLNRFPRVVVDGEERIQFSEFPAYLLRPKGEPKNQLTHLLFPENMITVPNADRSIQFYSSTTFPQITLLADQDPDELFVKILSQRVNEDGIIEQSSIILGMHEVSFISDIWDTFSKTDRQILAQRGYGPGMSHQQWAQAINRDMVSVPPRATMSKTRRLNYFRELPMLINLRGTIGTNGVYNMLPEFVLYALENNRFYYDEETPVSDENERLYDLGDVHIHSLANPMSPLQKAVADKVGVDVVRRNPSIPDIWERRDSQTLFSAMSKFYFGREIKAMTTFAGIITVDTRGGVQGARYFDFYNVDLKYLSDLNDRAYEELMNSPNPDVDLLAEHYRYIDSVTTEDFGTEDTSDHVGDPDYDRSQDPNIDFAMQSDEVGGIDFHPDNWSIESNGSSADIQAMQSTFESAPSGPIQGIVPVILNISPVTHFPMLLGYSESQSREILSRLDREDRMIGWMTSTSGSGNDSPFNPSSSDNPVQATPAVSEELWLRRTA